MNKTSLNKTPLVILGSLALLFFGFFGWNHVMLNQLDSELKAATESVENYHPEGEQGEAFDRMQELHKKYPQFFQGIGFRPADFTERTDLTDTATVFKNSIEEERAEIRDHVANSYLLTIGSRPKINSLIEKTDEKFVKDITNFAAFNPERIKLYEKSVEYCKTLPKGGNDFLNKQDIPAAEKYHLSLVLENAKTNLCPKL